ncbi:MAG: hypothetical protein AAGA97_01220 [Pseudomonadota bacterium]
MMRGMRDSDWQTATAAEKKLLHDAANRARQARNLTWKEFFRKALPRDPVAEGYEKNFRRGKIRPARAARIYSWLQTNEPDIASDFDRQLLKLRKNAGTSDEKLTWDGFVRLKGRFENVEVLAVKPGSMGIIEFAEDDPVADLKIVLRQKFYFRIKCPMNGVMAALQLYDRTWYPLSLTEGDPLLPVSKGTILAPFDPETKKPAPIYDKTHIGEHGFAFLISADEISLSGLRHAPPGQEVSDEISMSIVEEFLQKEDSEYHIFRCNIMIEL